jgi:hypothetical protein
MRDNIAIIVRGFRVFAKIFAESVSIAIMLERAVTATAYI